MKSPNTESYWKIWIDRILIIDLFLVIAGAVLFLLALILGFFGNSLLIRLFQLFWKPFFLPLITILISAVLVNGVFAWLQSTLLRRGTDK